MSTAAFHVDQRYPVTVVRLFGTLDDEVTAVADGVIRDCLADIPAALIIDASGLTWRDVEWDWLADLIATARRWPGIPVLICGDLALADGQSSVAQFGTVDEAMAELGDAAVPRERRQVVLPPQASSCGQARDLVAQACREWGVLRPLRLAEILVSELVAHGVTHAKTDLEVTVRRVDHALEVSVRDHGLPELPELSEDDPSGFGMHLVSELSDSWGCVPAGSGKVVWSRLPI